LRQQLGLSFGISTSFGLIIGFVIVALSMFSSVLDNLREFGTLKAIGATNADLTCLLLVQSLAYALVGSFVGLGLVTQVAAGIRGPKLVPIVPIAILKGVPLVMVVLCICASVLALMRIRRLEPGMVFR
jgi:putative ABC transport system permease protein